MKGTALISPPIAGVFNCVTDAEPRDGKAVRGGAFSNAVFPKARGLDAIVIL